LTTDDIPAIVKAFVSALPETSNATNWEDEPSKATAVSQDYNADTDDQVDEEHETESGELGFI